MTTGQIFPDVSLSLDASSDKESEKSHYLGREVTPGKFSENI